MPTLVWELQLQRQSSCQSKHTFQDHDMQTALLMAFFNAQPAAGNVDSISVSGCKGDDCCRAAGKCPSPGRKHMHIPLEHNHVTWQSALQILLLHLHARLQLVTGRWWENASEVTRAGVQKKCTCNGDERHSAFDCVLLLAAAGKCSSRNSSATSPSLSSFRFFVYQFNPFKHRPRGSCKVDIDPPPNSQSQVYKKGNFSIHIRAINKVRQ